MSILYEVFGSLLLFIFNLVNNYGVSIIVFTIISKLLLLPINIKQTKSLQETTKLQPEIQKIQKKFANNKEKINEETMKLYKEHNVNPMGGCLPLLIQFPIIIGLFRVLQQPAKYVFGSEAAYAAIEKSFLWLPSLGDPDPLHILPILAAATTYLYMTNMPSQSGGNDQAKQMNKTMKIMSPLMIGFFAWTFPSGVAIYWVTQNIFTYIQQFFIMRGTARKGVINK
ncbi:membrane protein insertase YidC [Alkalibaculum sp. M08DMB]|uniref:Membrane protein insertase YidC n=1 Tax=Alkalibaculum sporogenes TaxID=2655001 RepID=A0A6A7K895_9FIRM|nr:YidC/Oxa1 family membrane protein insertase [Alkalibaculum sporogenes]MPW25313.1 membrane protein insertase YidC [Alkalibaculum sporogenes]